VWLDQNRIKAKPLDFVEKELDFLELNSKMEASAEPVQISVACLLHQ